MSGIFLNFNGTSILQLMSFFILMYFLVKLLYKPFLAMLDKRREEVKSEYDKASKELEEAEKARKMAQEELNKIRKHVADYEEETKKRILEHELKEKALVNAEIDAMLKSARTEIEEEKLKAEKVFVKSAIPLNESDKKIIMDIIKSIRKIEPVLIIKVDPTLLAGIVIDFEDSIIDLSASGMLKNAVSFISGG